MAQEGNFKFTQNQLNEVDMGLMVTTVADPNRIVITSVNGYLQTSDITYTQLLAIIEGGGSGVTADNGLTFTSGNVQLGGVLVKDTDIDINESSLTIEGFEGSDLLEFYMANSSGDKAIALGLYNSANQTSSFIDIQPTTYQSSVSNSVDQTVLRQQYDNFRFVRSTGGGSNYTGFSVNDSSISSGSHINVIDSIGSVGMRYAADYSANNVSEDRWIVDKGYVDGNYVTLNTVQTLGVDIDKTFVSGAGESLNIYGGRIFVTNTGSVNYSEMKPNNVMNQLTTGGNRYKAYFANGRLNFTERIGAGAEFVLNFTVNSLTGNRSIAIPNASGTLALDANLVHLTGNEIIGGTKEFSQTAWFQNGVDPEYSTLDRNGLTVNAATGGSGVVTTTYVGFNAHPSFGNYTRVYANGVDFKFNTNVYVSKLTSENMSANYTWTLPSVSGKVGMIGTAAPSSATAAGVVGEIRVTSTFVYTCISPNVWVRGGMATW